MKQGFTEVWQYGSDNINDPLDKQDGVAPQVGIPNIENKQVNPIGGRAYIPNDGSVPRGFISSHSIDNYGWIFTRKTTDNGYVKPRQ